MQDKNKTAQTQVISDDAKLHSNGALEGGNTRRRPEKDDERPTAPARKIKYARREEYAPW